MIIYNKRLEKGRKYNLKYNYIILYCQVNEFKLNKYLLRYKIMNEYLIYGTPRAVANCFLNGWFRPKRKGTKIARKK